MHFSGRQIERTVLLALLITAFLGAAYAGAQTGREGLNAGMNQANAQTQSALERARLAVDQATQDLQAAEDEQLRKVMELDLKKAEEALSRIETIRTQLNDLIRRAAQSKVDKEAVCYTCVAQAGAVTAMYYSSSAQAFAQAVSQLAGGQPDAAMETSQAAQEALSRAGQVWDNYSTSLARLNKREYQPSIDLAKEIVPQCEESPEEIVAAGPGMPPGVPPGPPAGVGGGPPPVVPAVPDFAPAEPPVQVRSTE
jgi:hypothetical protein